MTSNYKVYGIVEKVSVPSFGIFDAPAKIDTGAYSGSLHCSKIKEVVRKSDGKRLLKFVPSDNHAHEVETGRFISTYVRSSTGHRVKRYVVDTEIVIDGETFPIRVGLSNRSDMSYEILIGRRFLREHNILVDVRKNQELDVDMEKKL